MVYAARLTQVEIQTIREVGFEETEDEAYTGWLSRRSREEVWGQVFTNAIVVAIRLVLKIDRE